MKFQKFCEILAKKLMCFPTNSLFIPLSLSLSNSPINQKQISLNMKYIWIKSKREDNYYQVANFIGNFMLF